MTRRRARADAAAGFTLIEVLIAVAVLAIALGASLDALNVFSDTQVRLRERYLGHLTAWNVMTDYRNERLQAPAADGFASLSTEGSEEQGGSIWQWSLQRKERREEDAEQAQAARVAIVVVDVYSPATAARRNSPPSATLQAIFGQ